MRARALVAVALAAARLGNGLAPPARPTNARRLALRRAADSEVLGATYFRTLDYEEASGDYVPWDLRGRPQPPVRKAAEAGAFAGRGPVLDCGCGAGDNANFLAARGVAVHGFDLCPSAVAAAESRRDACAAAIAAAGGRATFEVASALDLGASSAARIAAEIGGFDVVLDSALLHCLDDADAAAYVAELATLARPGAALFLGCFSDANRDPWTNPRRLSEAHIRARFCAENGWRVDALESAWYERPRDHRGASGMGAFTLAWWGEITRLPPPGP